jgi:hypothetical protein
MRFLPRATCGRKLAPHDRGALGPACVTQRAGLSTASTTRLPRPWPRAGKFCVLWALPLPHIAEWRCGRGRLAPPQAGPQLFAVLRKGGIGVGDGLSVHVRHRAESPRRVLSVTRGARGVRGEVLAGRSADPPSAVGKRSARHRSPRPVECAGACSAASSECASVSMSSS